MSLCRINAAEAREKMLNNPEAIILDVRSSREFAERRIPNAILLPLDEIKEKARFVLPNKSALILVYCRSGIRSYDATNLLKTMGYTNVCDFGGILDWPYETIR